MQVHADHKKRYMSLLVINYVILFLLVCSLSIISSTKVQTFGFELSSPDHPNMCPLSPFTDFTPRMLIISVSIGFNNLFFSWGNSYLPNLLSMNVIGCIWWFQSCVHYSLHLGVPLLCLWHLQLQHKQQLFHSHHQHCVLLNLCLCHVL